MTAVAAGYQPRCREILARRTPLIRALSAGIGLWKLFGGVQGPWPVRREAGEEERMKEPYGEGLAIHTDPESCAVVREGAGEALTGAHMGWVLSRERPSSEAPTLWPYGEGNMGGRAMASVRTASRGRKTPCR